MTPNGQIDHPLDKAAIREPFVNNFKLSAVIGKMPNVCCAGQSSHPRELRVGPSLSDSLFAASATFCDRFSKPAIRPNWIAPKGGYGDLPLIGSSPADFLGF